MLFVQQNIILSFLLFPLIALTAKPNGSNTLQFQDCLTKSSDSCLMYTPSITQRVFQWSCVDDIKYKCMHQYLELNKYSPTPQFYGKWPFWRFLGMQEPASVLFSLFNLLAHYSGLRRVLKVFKSINSTICQKRTRKVLFILIFVSICGVNAWIWSALFHSRDTLLTEKLDYFSAMLYILGLLHYGK